MWEWIKKQIIFIFVKKGQWLYIWMQCSLLIAVIQDEGRVTTNIVCVCKNRKKCRNIIFSRFLIYKNTGGWWWSSKAKRKKEGKHHHYVYNPQHQPPAALHECRSTLWIIWSSSFHSTRKSSPFRYPQVTFTFFSLRPPTHTQTYIGWNCEWMVIQDDDDHRSSPWNCVCVFKVFNKREMNFPCVEKKTTGERISSGHSDSFFVKVYKSTSERTLVALFGEQF